MKRIIFLIIASVLILGLVLPGCGNGVADDFDQYITFAVPGPMDNRQGEHHWAAAEMARDDINNAGAGGVVVGGLTYGIKLTKVDTNEVAGTPSEGVNALTAVINDVDFVVGGFRTESVVAYREVAMDAKKIFLNCGAATGSLQWSVTTDYDRYKYWFKTTPYNETFLTQSLLKLVATLGGGFNATLTANDGIVHADYKISNAVGNRPRVALIIENLSWADQIAIGAPYYLGLLGYNATFAVQRPANTATDIGTMLDNVEADKPHIILTAFSGPVGLTYSKQRAEKAIPALTIGINVEGQSKGAWYATNQGCNYDIMLDTSAENVAVTAGAVAWFNAFVAKVGDYPLYTSATYDAIKMLVAAIEAENSLSEAVLIPYLETHTYTGVGTAKSGLYPLGDIEVCGACGDGGDPILALNQTQKEALYGASYTYNQADWTAGYAVGPPVTQLGHMFHDTVYGPGWQTGIGAQWQDGHKVGIWPMVVGAPLVDQYGDWNFAYTGTVAPDLATVFSWFLA